MMFWIICLCAFAWTSINCEPPVNTYLPPESGSNARPQHSPSRPDIGRTPGRYSPSGPNGQNNQVGNSYLPPSPSSQGGLDSEYGLPSDSQRGQNIPQGGFGQDIPNTRSPSPQYGVPSQGNRPTNTNQQQFGNEQPENRQPLQSSYGPPAHQENINPGNNRGLGPNLQRPSSSYGPPSGGSDYPGATDTGNGYNQRPEPLNDARSSNPSSFGAGPNGYGSELGGNDEPAKYEFNYNVDDPQTGTKFGHSEQRDGDVATGEYNVVLPDGRKQVVQYEADQEGYKPQIRYEGEPQSNANAFAQSQASASSGYPQSAGHIQPDQGGGGYPSGQQPNGIGSQTDYQSIPGGNQIGSGPNAQGGPNEGYPRGGPNESGYPRGSPQRNINRGSPNGDGGYPRGSPQTSTPARSQQGDSGYPRGSPQRNTDDGSRNGDGGYPRGGPSGRGFPGNLPLGSSSGEGPQKNDEGYPRGRPRGTSRTGTPNSSISPGGGYPSQENGYSNGRPQGNGRNSFNRPQENNQGEGYPSGGPSGVRGTGY